MAMRADTFPADGNSPGSDPELAYRQLILQAGSDIGILGRPAGRASYQGQLGSHGRAEPLAARPLAGFNRQLAPALAGLDLRRGRGPRRGGPRNREWAGHPYIAQVLVKAEPRPAWGDPKYDPLWAAAVRHDLPVSCHLSRGYHEQLPMPPVGFPSYNHDFMATYSLLAANQVMSLVFDGVFERFPTLKIVLVEHAFNWILPLMWGLDADYEARRSDLTEVRRKPSEYIKDHIKFTTQPLDYPAEDKLDLANAFEWMEANQIAAVLLRLPALDLRRPALAGQAPAGADA